jgi:hypothetical protein
MAWKRNVLVVANVTATSAELLAALKQRAQGESPMFTLIVPATPFGGGRKAAVETLEHALAKLREAELECEGAVGVPDPLVAVTDVWDPKRFDEIIVSTLPVDVSKWFHAGLPERISKLTGAPVTHVVSRPPKPVVAPMAAPRPAETGVLRPLSVLAWGGHKDR